MLNWSGKAPSREVEPRPAATVTSPAPARAQPVYADRGGVAPAPRSPAALPASLYDTPAAPPTRAAPASEQPTAPSPLIAATPYGVYQPRAYSVVREYGGTPDRIPAPPPQTAFTGPEVSLTPGLFGAAPQDDPANDADTDDTPERRPAKDKR